MGDKRKKDRTKAMDPKSGEKKKKEGMIFFADGAYWWQLTFKYASVKEPENASYWSPRALTIDAEEARYVPTKYNFGETFDRAVFK